jgi:transposase
METNYILGIDISKMKLDAALTCDGKSFYEVQIENQPDAINKFFGDLKTKISSLSNLIICIEHTGIYGLPLLKAVVKKKLRICVEPARQIKLSQGMTRGKSDTLDARRIASYAFKNCENLVFWAPQRECVQKLKALLTTREGLIKAKLLLEKPVNEAREFIGAAIHKDMAKYIRASVAALKKNIMQTDKAIRELVSQDRELSKQCEFATSIPGVGMMVACNVIVASGEFKRINDPKKFACYAGVAPFEHSSGSSIRGKTRVSKMANMNIKALLHLAAMSAIQCNGDMKAYYQRKVSEGKNKMSVLNAVRNKLIGRIYACINQQKVYQKDYQNVLA